jgi:hypothetical protein
VGLIALLARLRQALGARRPPCHPLVFAVDHPTVVLQFDAERKFVDDVAHKVLRAPAVKALRLRGRGEQVAHGIESTW